MAKYEISAIKIRGKHYHCHLPQPEDEPSERACWGGNVSGQVDAPVRQTTKRNQKKPKEEDHDLRPGQIDNIDNNLPARHCKYV